MGKSELRLELSKTERGLYESRLDLDEFFISSSGLRHIRVRNPRPNHPFSVGHPVPVACFVGNNFYLVNTGVAVLREYHTKLKQLYQEVTGRPAVEE